MKRKNFTCQRCKEKVYEVFDYIPVSLNNSKVDLRFDLRMKFCENCYKSMKALENDCLGKLMRGE